MIDIEFKHGCPEDVYVTRLEPGQKIRERDLRKLLDCVTEIKSITVEGDSRLFINDAFMMALTLRHRPKTVFLVGETAQQILGQILYLVLQEETDLYEIVDDYYTGWK